MSTNSGQITEFKDGFGVIYCPKLKTHFTFPMENAYSKLQVGDDVVFRCSVWSSRATDIFKDERPVCSVFKVCFRERNYFKINSLGVAGGLKFLDKKSKV